MLAYDREASKRVALKADRVLREIIAVAFSSATEVGTPPKRVQKLPKFRLACYRDGRSNNKSTVNNHRTVDVLVTYAVSRGMSTTQQRTKVVGYIRVSTESQADEGVSLAAQRTKLEAYAVAMDLDLVAMHEDAGVSAKTLNRPGLQAALDDLDAGRATGLLVAKLDRLTRSVVDLGALVSRYFAESRKAELLSVADSIDTRSAAGRLCLNVLVSVAQWEREATAERTRDALGHIKSQGAMLGGEALGWERTESTDEHGRRIVVEVRDEVATVERIRELRAEGLTLRAICERLASDGHRTKRGGKWHANTVRQVLLRVA